MKFAINKRLKASPCMTCELSGGKSYNCHQDCKAYLRWAETYKKYNMKCREIINNELLHKS